MTFFPYMSIYQHLLNGSRRTPWDFIPPGMGMGGMMGDDDSESNYGMRPWWRPQSRLDPNTHDAQTGTTGEGSSSHKSDRSGLYSGLLAFGTGMLSADPGDFSGGLARGAAGFTQAAQAEQERLRRDALDAAEERRRQNQDTRAAQQDEDRHRAAELGYEQSKAEYDAWKEEQSRGKEVRLRTGKSAEQMVDEIQRLADDHPDDPKLQSMARRAAGYSLGNDSDLNKLAVLHDQMTEQAYRQSDYEWQTKADIGRRQAEVAAGVAPDVGAAERRANRELDLSAARVKIEQDRSNREATTLQQYDRIERKANEILNARIRAYVSRSKTGSWPSAEVIARWRQEAFDDARNYVGTNLHYTETGELVPE